jgi:hypothetical protein
MMGGGVGLSRPTRKFEILDVDPTADADNYGRFWYNSVDKQAKIIVDDGLGGFKKVILG